MRAARAVHPYGLYLVEMEGFNYDKQCSLKDMLRKRGLNFIEVLPGTESFGNPYNPGTHLARYRYMVIANLDRFALRRLKDKCYEVRMLLRR